MEETTMRRQFLTVLIIALCAPLVMAASPAPPKSVIWSMATGSPGGTNYPLGAAIAKVVADHVPGMKITVQATGASVENMRLVGKKEVQLGMSSASIVQFAYEGREMFREPYKNLRVIGYMYPDVIQIYTADPNIKTIADFKGKKIGIGPAGSSNEFVSRDVLSIYGLTFSDINGIKASYDQMADLFKDHQVAANIVQTGFPNSSIQDVTLLRPVQFLSVDRDKLFAKFPYYAAFTIPANGYKGLAAPYETALQPNLMVCQDSLDEEAVYQFTKAMYEYHNDIAAIHQSASVMTLENALKGVPIPLHPGAERYFKEKGVKK
jgi:uncharacterized protein